MHQGPAANEHESQFASSPLPRGVRANRLIETSSSVGHFILLHLLVLIEHPQHPSQLPLHLLTTHLFVTPLLIVHIPLQEPPSDPLSLPQLGLLLRLESGVKDRIEVEAQEGLRDLVRTREDGRGNAEEGGAGCGVGSVGDGRGKTARESITRQRGFPRSGKEPHRYR